ncbi:MAG: pantoate--beta-alanine ligase [Thermoflexibacter sp.]|jgi:pantoate--beta-alanine ligase|nr:pantoate--beta-alanine ligase [Thermoflexibacter sp.]
MQIFYNITEIRTALRSYQSSQSIGFVPTMGALHEGHLSLIRLAKQENEKVVCSIFVNPTQFNHQEDLLQYPRTVAEDIVLLKNSGCDYLFLPSEKEMYPVPMSLGISFGALESVMEGRHRPGHFNGVGVVVSKLFNIVKPQKVYFGQKDLQQCMIINLLVKQLNFDVSLRICPTVREADGLAMSSRNRRLTPTQRQIAPKIYEALNLAKTLLAKGDRVGEAQQKAIQFLNDFNVFTVEYFDIIDAEDLTELPSNMKMEHTTRQIAICTAVKLGDIRLIDNILINL